VDLPKTEYWRKAIHLSGLFFIPILLWNRSVFAALLATFLIVYLLVEFLAKRGKWIPLLSALTENSKREKERGRLSRGALFLVASGIALPYLLGSRAAAVGLTQIFTADVSSTLVGMKWGRKRLPWCPSKSWVGSLTYFATAFVAACPFVPPLQALMLAGIGSAVESLPIPEADNLTVPLAVGWAARLLT
jgi:dolichol kinase